ncbi:MAG: arginase [Burkholderiaceae bacterium]
MRPIRLTGAPVDSGSPFIGCAGGPDALRASGLIDALAANGRPVIDAGNLVPMPARPISHPNESIRTLSSAAAWVQSLQQSIAAQPENDWIDLFLGGDHLMAAGTIPPLAARAEQLGRPLFCLWLDAHTDFHSLCSTDTGNLHGTPAAYICGQPGFTDAFPPLPATLEPSKLCMLGIRSVDEAELAWLEPLQTRLIGMEELDTVGVAAAVKPFLDRVRRADGLLHLSFDVDCLDPRDAPGVGTAVPGGVRLSQAQTLMRCLNESQLVTSVDIAELNPKIDQTGRTAAVVVDLMSQLFSQTSRQVDLPSQRVTQPLQQVRSHTTQFLATNLSEV